METIITIATVLTMYFNAANDVNAPYLYNADLENGVIHNIEVYDQKPGNQLEAKMVYHYDYDEQGRLTTREVSRWDSKTKRWVSDLRHTYKYYKNGYNVETCHFNATTGTYDLPEEVTLYRTVSPSVTSVKTYRMNETKDDMYMSNKMLVMEPINHRLLATN